MLILTIGTKEGFNEETEEFVTIDDGGAPVRFEHSLISLSKWESKYQKPFLGEEAKTPEEALDYIRFMIVDDNVDPKIVDACSPEDMLTFQEYIQSSQSATTFGKLPDKGGQTERITSELIYYWLVAFTIPWEAETWHLQRLFSLIKICNIKNSKDDAKIPRHQVAQEYRDENARRKALMKTRG